MATVRSRGVSLVALLTAMGLACTPLACSRSKSDSSAKASDAPSKGRVGGAGQGDACEWLPADAREVTPTASLQGEPGSDPLCTEHASELDAPKAAIVAIERELRQSTKMSDEEEARIGQRLEASLSRERTFRGKLDLPEDVQKYKSYVTDIVQAMVAKSTRPNIKFRIHTVRSPVFNAAALPGGVLLVFTGTLEGKEAVISEAELAGVLGHEIAHVERRHVVAAYQYARAALGSDSDEAVIAMRILSQPLSTEHELEADERGIELMTLAGYDPQAVVDLWHRKAKTEPDEQQPRQRRAHGGGRGGRGGHGRHRGEGPPGPGGGRGGGPEEVLEQVFAGLQTVIRSHPPAAERACKAAGKMQWAREHAPCDRLYDGKSNIAVRVAGPQRAF